MKINTNTGRRGLYVSVALGSAMLVVVTVFAQDVLWKCVNFEICGTGQVGTPGNSCYEIRCETHKVLCQASGSAAHCDQPSYYATCTAWQGNEDVFAKKCVGYVQVPGWSSNVACIKCLPY